MKTSNMNNLFTDSCIYMRSLGYLPCNTIYAHKQGHSNTETKGGLSFENDSLLWNGLGGMNYIPQENTPEDFQS